MSITAYPLSWPSGWPRNKYPGEWSHGRGVTLDKARKSVLAELRKLDARNVILSSNVPLRLDGEIRATAATARMDDAGVAVYFALRGKPMVMARDAYWRVEQNMRSLALAIEHLRGLERHGGAHMMERAFQGFSALPPPNHATSAPQMPNWRQMLGPIPDGLAPSDLLAVVEGRYRRLAKDAHADTGGSNERMVMLNTAIAEARIELTSR